MLRGLFFISSMWGGDGGVGVPVGFRGLACGEATDQLSHKADALKVIFQTDVLIGSVQVGARMAHPRREGRYA